jgi:Co/Zn/Cd efflux system component
MTKSSTAHQKPYRRALWTVIVINVVMFQVEITAGIAANSQALLADALDFFGDTLTYAMP